MKLQLCLTVGFILVYTQQVLVEKFLHFLKNTLPATATSCWHTNLVHIHALPDGNHKGMRYMWVHLKIQLQGQDLLVQCPNCFSI